MDKINFFIVCELIFISTKNYCLALSQLVPVDNQYIEILIYINDKIIVILTFYQIGELSTHPR